MFFQAIEFTIKLPCKFSGKGCEYEGTKAILQVHMRSCSFRDIECQYPIQLVKCKKRVKMTKFLDHLRNDHKSDTLSTHALGKAIADWDISSSFRHQEFNPFIFPYDGHIFLLNGKVTDFNLSLWVSVIDTKEGWEKYEVQISHGNQGQNSVWSGCSGKVYSTDISHEDVLQDGKGVLELSKNHLRKVPRNERGNYSLTVNYDIAYYEINQSVSE